MDDVTILEKHGVAECRICGLNFVPDSDAALDAAAPAPKKLSDNAYFKLCKNASRSRNSSAVSPVSRPSGIIEVVRRLSSLIWFR